MNGYLVLARGVLDDIPLGLFKAYDDAEDFANAATVEGVCSLAARVYKLDTSVVTGIDIVRFDGGEPVRVYDVIDFTVEEGGDT